MTKPQKIEGGKTKPLTEKRIREIVREEIAKIPPTYMPVPYPYPSPTPVTPYQPYQPQPWTPMTPPFIVTCETLSNPSNIK